MKVIVTTYRTSNANRVQIEVREDAGGSLQEMYAGIEVSGMVKFRNTLLDRLSNKYEAVTAHPLPEIPEEAGVKS